MIKYCANQWIYIVLFRDPLTLTIHEAIPAMKKLSPAQIPVLTLE